MRNDTYAGLALLSLAAACGRSESSRSESNPPAGTQGMPAESTTASEPSGPELLAYVTNEDSQELSVIDTRTNKVVTTIAVGTRPRGVRVSPDGKTVYVALSGSPKCPPTMPDEECAKLQADKSKDGIAVVDGASRKVARVLPGGSDPENFDVSKDGTTLFISNEDAGTASIVDVRSGKIRSTVKVGREPEGVRVHPDGKTVWVTGETDHNVTIIDTKTGKALGQIEVGKRPRALDFTPDGKLAFVTSEVGGTTWVVDVKARKVRKVITMPKDSKPMGVVVSPDARRVYVSNGRGGTVSVIDVATDSILASVPVGARPWGIALTPDGRNLYSANGSSNDVSLLDTDKLEVTTKVPVGKVPWGVAIAHAP
jgi:YVTN family beta-propeller protein